MVSEVVIGSVNILDTDCRLSPLPFRMEDVEAATTAGTSIVFPAQSQRQPRLLRDDNNS